MYGADAPQILSRRRAGMHNHMRPMLPRGYRRDSYLSIQGVRPTPLSVGPLAPIEPCKILEEATVFLVKHIDKNQDAIIELIQKRRYPRRLVQSMQYYAARCLEDFGHVLFADQVMKRSVTLSASPFNTQDMSGRTYIAGARNSRDTKPHIRLNSVLLESTRHHHRFQDPKGTYDHIIATLLHHMIHAYFLIACGAQRDGKDPDGRLKHGEHFGCVMYKIRDLSGRYGSPLPISFGHNIPVSHHGHSYHGFFNGMVPASLGQQYSQYQCSTCTANVEAITKEKIEDWYKNKCVKAVDPDILEVTGRNEKPIATPLSKCGDKKKWVEIIYHKQTYKVTRDCLSKIVPSSRFLKNFDGDNRVLRIRDVVEEPIFICLLHFLYRADYLPDLDDNMSGTSTAPIIHQRLHDEAKAMMTDIKVHQLATEIGFEKLRFHALKRLKSHPICYENPCALLSAIYEPVDQGLNKELRAWAIDFMKKLGHPKPGQHPKETSNWKKLDDDPTFRDLLGYLQSTQLCLDFDRVGHELETVAAELPPPPSIPYVWDHTQFSQHPWFGIPSHGPFQSHKGNHWPFLSPQSAIQTQIEPRGYWIPDRFDHRVWYDSERPLRKPDFERAPYGSGD
jgi:hypothetical protein